ncbi:MAG: protein kinase [candidate division Zixibacteria bacterium]|nr:protein kinase [candidate division Zixibacteria bacterium]
MNSESFDNDKTQTHVVLTKGTTVAHYRIVEKIGAGGMGEVYLAEDTKLKREVALKLLSPHLCQDEECRERFKREAQAAAKLDHPNIVPVFEVGVFKGRPFFAMAHIEGQSLGEVIKEGKLTVSEAINLTMQICEGLHKAHESGVVHRDIKPANIIIDKENRPRLLDFGLATVTGAKKLTKTGSTMGTLGYMSPEQIQGEKTDHRSDLFSVGVILYEMIAGRTPFEGEYEAAIHFNIVHEEAEPLSRYKSGVSGELQQIVGKALSKDVSLRYQHADGIVADLKRLEVGSGPAKKSKLGLWAAVAVVVILAGYFTVDRFMHPDIETTEGWTNSVAVLVFRNLSGDPEQDYFCEGMTDEIIGRLGTIKGLKVTSMQSMLRFKGTDLDLKKIGKELGVENILEGRIQISGDDIRVRAQLIRVEDDAHIWTEKYDRELKSVFAIQDDISRAIAKVLEATLVDSKESFASRHGTDDIEAYNAYVRGRHFWRKRTDENLVKAIEQFELAISLDENYAQAWSGLADAWMLRPGYGNVTQKIAYPKADSAARRALELGPHLAEAHSSWARYLGRRGLLEKAEQSYLKALELNPGYSWAHMWYYTFLLGMGRDPALQFHHLNTAYELDPVSIPVLGNLAHYYYTEGDLDKAVDFCRRQLELAPTSYHAYSTMAWSYVALGDTMMVYRTLDSLEHYAAETWQAHTYRAEVLNQYDEKQEAEVAYRKAIEVAPDNWQPYDRLGRFYSESQRKYQEGEDCFLRAIALDSTQPAPHSGYGHNLRMQGRMDESIEQSRLAMELAPYDPETFRAYGWAIGNGLRRYDEAITYMEKALHLNPRHLFTLTSISLMYANAGQFEEAIQAINDAIDVDRSYTFAQFRKANILVMAGEYDSAGACYRTLHDLLPTDTWSLIRLGQISAQLGDFQTADSFFTICCSLSEPWSRARCRYYALDPLLRQGMISAAIAQAENGIRLDSEEVGDHHLMLWKYISIIDESLRLLSNHAKTLRYIEQAEALVGRLGSGGLREDASLISFRATILTYMGEPDSGLAMLRDAMKDPKATSRDVDGLYRLTLADLLATSGKFDEAVDIVRKLTDDEPDFQNQVHLGFHYLQAGRHDEAVTALEGALATWDENRLNSARTKQVMAVYYLGQAYEGAGRTDEAIEQYETFLDIWKNADEGLKSVEDAKERLASLKHGT